MRRQELRRNLRQWLLRLGAEAGLIARGGLVAAMLLIGDAAWAQEEPAEAPASAYSQLEIPDSLDERNKPKSDLPAVRKKLQDLKVLVNGVLSGEQPLQPNQAQFDGYYLQYVFPQLTWLKTIESPENFNSLYRTRSMFMVDLRRASPPVHDHMLPMAFEKLKEIASGDFHPAARINAMLIIVELNQKEMVRSGTVTPPDPYLPALPFLVDVLEDKNQIDGVRVVALLGILRQIQWDSRIRESQAQGTKQQITKVDDALRDRINQLALAIINAAAPPPGRTVEGHAWMQRRAIDVLGALGTIGTNVNAASTIENMVGDDKAPLSLRCGAAEALGLINLPPETKLSATETAGKLGELALSACRNELKRIEDDKKHMAESAAGRGAGGVGPMGMSGGAPGPGGAGPTGGFDDGPGGGPPGMAGMPGMGGMGGMMPGRGGAMTKAKLDAYKLEVAQRRLKSQLHSVKIGLAGMKDRTTGVMGLAKDGTKERDTIAKLAKEVTDLRDATDGDDIKDLDKLVTEVKKRVRDLETATKATVALAKPAPKAKADEPDEPDAPDAPAGKPAGKPAAKPAAEPADEPAAEDPPAKPSAKPAEKPAPKPADEPDAP